MEKGVKWRRKEGKLEKERWKIEMEGGKSSKMRRGPFFFLFFFLLFTFQNDKNLFWVIKMEIFYREKAFHAGKKI